MNNCNCPIRGSSIKVDPIVDQNDISTIKKILTSNARNFCIFVLGVNTALRGSELLSIKVSQVKHLRPGDDLEIKEGKTKKYRRVTLNKSACGAIQILLSSKFYREDDFLFTGQRGVLTVSYLCRLVKSWCKSIGLKGNYGSHSLRKTWGYQMRVRHNVDLVLLCDSYGHSSQKQTLTYLCIQPDEKRSVYLTEI